MNYRVTQTFLFSENTHLKGQEATISSRISNSHYSDDPALLANTPAQAESFLHTLEQEVSGIGLYMNSDKTEFMYF